MKQEQQDHDHQSWRFGEYHQQKYEMRWKGWQLVKHQG
jgi:hypothetical protein